MPNIRPFRAVRPGLETAEKVYIHHLDAGSSDKSAQALANPYSMLHVSHVNLTLSPEEASNEDFVQSRAKENLKKYIMDGVLLMEEEESLYVYRISLANHAQTGLVACLDIEDYIESNIKRHELTRMDKIHTQATKIKRVGGSIEPILLTYDSSLEPEISKVLEDYTFSHDSEIDFFDRGGIRHEVWAVSDRDFIRQMEEFFGKIPSLYICDGHHRIAASGECYVTAETPEEKEQNRYFMAAIFPSDEMLILDYNRAIKDLNGLTEEEFYDALRAAGFEIEKLGLEPEYPRNIGEYSMVMDDNWYRLKYVGERNSSDPVGNLDVSIIQNKVFRDILGVRDPQHDDRITFISGTKGLDGLQKSTHEGMKVAFAILPPKMSDIMCVSDAGLTMPPKSTCFEPKLAGGILNAVKL